MNYPISGFIIHCFFVLIFLVLILSILYTIQLISDKPLGKGAFQFFKSNFLIFCGFSILGLSVGLLSGSSLTPVMGEIVPSILTFLGLIAVYQFASDKMPDVNRNIVALAILLNCIFLLYGNEMSSIHRMKVQEEKIQKEHDRKKELETHKSELQIKFNKELETHKNELQKQMKNIEYQLDSLKNKWEKN